MKPRKENNIVIHDKKLFKLFPYLNDKSKLYKLKIDPESIYYITIRNHAEKINQIIINQLKSLNYNPKESIITDATAGVGGNTISFALNFKSVNAIEIDQIRVEYLKNNISIYELNNVQIYEGDCTKIISNIDNHQVIFIDPIWGGPNYKNHENLRLLLGDQQIENFCIELMNPKIMKKVPDLIVFKLPKNYDIIYFYKKINEYKKKIYYYDLFKMIILVIICKNDNE